MGGTETRLPEYFSLKRPCKTECEAAPRNTTLFFLRKERALLMINSGVHILSIDLLDTYWNSLSPNSAMTKALGHLR